MRNVDADDSVEAGVVLVHCAHSSLSDPSSVRSRLSRKMFRFKSVRATTRRGGLERDRVYMYSSAVCVLCE